MENAGQNSFGKIKRGVTNKGKTYYYQLDKSHIPYHVEVYKKCGSKGEHMGIIAVGGGPIIKNWSNRGGFAYDSPKFISS